MESKTITTNKVTVYSYPSEHLHKFCIGLYVKAGVLYEKDDENGITHFWEHIEFRNLNRLYEGNFNRVLDSCGMSFNAFTYKEFVYFKISGAKKHFNTACEIITKILSPLQIDKADIDNERKRIKREYIEDDDKSSLEFFTNKIAWKGTKLERNIIGTIKNINKITLKKLKMKKEKLLTSNNIFFYVTGSFSKENISFLCNQISMYQISIDEEPRKNLVYMPNDFQKRGAVVEIKNNYYNYVRFTFDMKTNEYSLMELNLLYDLLFSGESSRFYKKMSEELGLIYDFDAKLEQYSNYGMFYFQYEISAKYIYESITNVVMLLSDLKHFISKEDMDVILPHYIDNAELLLDEPEELNWEMAYNIHILNSQHKSIEEIKKAYESITPQRLQQVAQEIFLPENLIVTLKGDKKKIDLEKIKKIVMDV